MMNISDIEGLCAAMRSVDGGLSPGITADINTARACRAAWLEEKTIDPDTSTAWATIYGLGGSTRYFVELETGEVWFSTYHSDSAQQQKANDAGFRLR